jgi:DNA (cytosine-5)-methyltransferase 1
MIDTFSGIGGFSLAARWLGGIETVQFVEREPYCQRIINKHWPDVPIHDDICTFQPQPGSADIVCGGFPCQDISQAGRQAGIKVGTRSGLFYELMRVIRVVGPRFVVLENVAAIVSGGLDIVLGELAEAGFDAEWACIPASAVGACHRRDRW